MITRNVMTAEFPEGSIQVTDVNYVASGIANLDPIAHPIRLTNEDIDPGDEAFHRRLHSQSKND